MKENSISSLAAAEDSGNFTSKRPSSTARTFLSEGVEDLIRQTKASIADPELAWMFENCYPNTLDTTVDFEILDGRPDTFIITGDIDAMWLRDSTAQVWPYLPLMQDDSSLQEMVAGLINRQVKCILIDPYANAFFKDMSRKPKWTKDDPTPVPGVLECKWEVDSLCYAVRLAYHYYQRTGDDSVFDSAWDKAMRSIVATFRVEQRKEGKSPYRFVRRTTSMVDSVVFEGTGRPTKPTGLICSSFRPSDDATLFSFLIPSNLFAMCALRQLAEIYNKVRGNTAFAEECNLFAQEIEKGIQDYSISDHLDFGEIYAYEVDGFGNKVFMDDANVPSLLSLPYLDESFVRDEVYWRTRQFLMSESNPYFIKGVSVEGQGSPHTGKENIWPMGIIMRAMTSKDEKEIRHCLAMLKATHAKTGLMHESFLKDDPTQYSRPWFAWTNTLFGELCIRISEQYPHLLNEIF